MSYTMNADETAKAEAIRLALTTAKQKLSEVEDQIIAARNNADALMASQKAAGRADSYNAAFRAREVFKAMRGKAQLLQGEVGIAHADMSGDLQRLFTDGPAFALAAPGR